MSIKNIIICISTLFPMLLFSQPTNDNVFKYDLTGSFFSTQILSYEKVFYDNYASIQITASGTLKQINIWDELTAQLIGYSIEFQPRHYFDSILEIDNLYTGVYLKYSEHNLVVHTIQDKIDLLNGNSKVVGIVFGWQKEIADRFYMDLTIGGGYHIADYSGRISQYGSLIPSIISNGFLPKLSIKAGYGF